MIFLPDILYCQDFAVAKALQGGQTRHHHFPKKIIFFIIALPSFYFVVIALPIKNKGLEIVINSLHIAYRLLPLKTSTRI